jgi:hypothetical protein
MKNPVTVKLPDERRGTFNGESLCFPAGTELAGELALEPSDGPWGIREYEQPHYLTATFDFTFDGRYLRYSGFVTQWNLWAPTGTQVQTGRAGFVDQAGRIDGMMDDREEWSYVLPDGRTHRNRLKYMSCHFWIMAEPTSLLVKCQYYDQNPGIAGMVTIFYSRPLEELLLLRDTRVLYDSRGKPEDFDIHGGDTITLELGGEPPAAASGYRRRAATFE